MDKELEQERAAFEQFMRDEYGMQDDDLRIRRSGSYHLIHVDNTWDGWCARVEFSQRQASIPQLRSVGGTR